MLVFLIMWFEACVWFSQTRRKKSHAMNLSSIDMNVVCDKIKHKEEWFCKMKSRTEYNKQVRDLFVSLLHFNIVSGCSCRFSERMSFHCTPEFPKRVGSVPLSGFDEILFTDV